MSIISQFSTYVKYKACLPRFFILVSFIGLFDIVREDHALDSPVNSLGISLQHFGIFKYT